MEASGSSPSLVLVEQHEALRDGLAVLLERRGFSVLGCATTAANAEEVIAERHPDVVVVGVDLPDERGTELILAMLARGLTGEEVAQHLVLSPETVRTHIRNAMGKLEARTRTEAVVKALERQEILRP